MTREQIIRLWDEANNWGIPIQSGLAEELERFAALVAAAALAEDAMQRLTDVHQEMEKTHTSVDNEYTPVKPVAWRTKNATPPGGYVVFQQYPSAVANLGGEIEPLYTAPPKHKPLTDEQLESIEHKAYLATISKGKPMGDYATELMRAIERAHGIGGEE